MKRKIGKRYVGSRFLNRILISVVILLIIIGTAIYETLLKPINVILPIVSLVLGSILGLTFFDRILKIFWLPKTQKVESRFDKTGLIFLIIYIAIIGIGRKWLFPYLIDGTQVYVLSLIFTAGLLLGRVLVTIKDIKRILVQENKF